MRQLPYGLVVLFTIIAASNGIAHAQGEPPALQPPKNAPPYQPTVRDTEGRCLALTMKKLREGFEPPRPFLIWAIGSSYTARLGAGDEFKTLIREKFPDAPPIEYRRMVGNSVPWQYIRGWARQMVIPDQPDLVLINTIGDPADLEKLIVELQSGCTADIVVPSIHWRVPDKPHWAKDDDGPYWGEVRDICRKHGVEFVENRRDWGAYLRANKLEIEDLLGDNVHQSPYGAHIVRTNIVAHLREPAEFAYRPTDRERRIEAENAAKKQITFDDGWRSADGVLRASKLGAKLTVSFTGDRIDLIGERTKDGGTLRVLIDGAPADRAAAFHATYIQPQKGNHQAPRDPARDKSPHGVRLGEQQTPQTWTIEMLDDEGSYELRGSVTGADGRGNSTRPFVSESGQIAIEPDLWRRPERNHRGDKFIFDVQRATVDRVSLRSDEEHPAGKFRIRLAQNLPAGEHQVELVSEGASETVVDAFDVFQPPSDQ